MPEKRIIPKDYGLESVFIYNEHGFSIEAVMLQRRGDGSMAVLLGYSKFFLCCADTYFRVMTKKYHITMGDTYVGLLSDVSHREIRRKIRWMQQEHEYWAAPTEIPQLWLEELGYMGESVESGWITVDTVLKEGAENGGVDSDDSVVGGVGTAGDGDSAEAAEGSNAPDEMDKDAGHNDRETEGGEDRSENGAGFSE